MSRRFAANKAIDMSPTASILKLIMEILKQPVAAALSSVGQAERRDEVIEQKLLDQGVVSLDGLNGMDFERAVKVATFSVPMAKKHFFGAMKAGLV